MSGFQIFMAVVGGLAVLAGLLTMILRVRTVLVGASADGVVVELARGSTIHSREGSDAEVMLDPVVEFHHEGKTFRFKSSLGTKSGIPVGQRVVVRYLPSDPESTAEIGTALRMFGFPVIALFAGAVMLGVAAWDAGWLAAR